MPAKKNPRKLFSKSRWFWVLFGLVSSTAFTLDRPLTFVQAGEMAAAASLELQTELALQTLQETSWQLGIREFFPSITVTASEDERVSVTGPDSFSKMYTVSLQQPLFDGGKMVSARRIEKAQLLLQKDALQNMLRETAENAIAAYRQILQGRMTLAIKRKSQAALERQRKILDKERELGLALDSDLVEADIMLEQTRIEMITGEMDLAEQEKQFAETLGLDTLPVLAEAIDVNRLFVLPGLKEVQSAILARNPELLSAQLAIRQKEEEAKFASRLWIPTIKGTGSFSLTGDRYPLSHYKWSFGITVDLSAPWIGSTTSGNYGEEGATEKNAQLSESLKLAPSPASGLSEKSAKLTLRLEREKYALMVQRVERNAALLLEKLAFLIQKKDLTVRSKELAFAKLQIAETKNKLGHITRLEIMRMEIEYAQNEIACVNAAVDIVTAVREMEKLMAIPDGIGGNR
jgi:outer membrane protein TolC